MDKICRWSRRSSHARISIDFEIRSKFGGPWVKVWSTNHNETVHTSRQTLTFAKCFLWSVDYLMNKSIGEVSLNFEFDGNIASGTGAKRVNYSHLPCTACKFTLQPIYMYSLSMHGMKIENPCFLIFYNIQTISIHLLLCSQMVTNMVSI